MLVVLLCRHAFAADSLLSLVYQIVRGSYPPLPANAFSAEMTSLVHQLLTQDSSKRPSLSQVYVHWVVVHTQHPMMELFMASQHGGKDCILVCRHGVFTLIRRLRCEGYAQDRQVLQVDSKDAQKRFAVGSCSADMMVGACGASCLYVHVTGVGYALCSAASSQIPI